MIKKIISGGQTGADRAALDVAIKMGIEHGGWLKMDHCLTNTNCRKCPLPAIPREPSKM
jgi:hypothetical protein